MRLLANLGVVVALAAGLWSAQGFSAGRPEDDFAVVVKALTVHGEDWRSIEAIPAIRWAPLPPKMLENCLPDGGCFTRGGRAMLGDRQVSVMATGARTMTSNVYFKNSGAHVGEAALVQGLSRAGLQPVLARCPAKPGAISKWWRIKTGGHVTGFVSRTVACGAAQCEGLAFHSGDQLPGLDPRELALYSESCGAGGASGAPLSVTLPHEEIARTIAAVLPTPAEPAPPSWAVIRARLPGLKWQPGALMKRDPRLMYDDDPNTLSLAGYGMAKLATREFSAQVTGDAKSAKLFRLEEQGSHPRGEDAALLRSLQSMGFSIALARCGKPYTQQKLVWYRLASAKTRPSYLLIDTGFEGPREHARYRVYLDGLLPTLKPGEANAGSGACR